MASPSSVLTRGLGSWGSVNLMVTLGYGIAEVVAADPGVIFYVTSQPASIVVGSDHAGATWHYQSQPQQLTGGR